VNSRCQVCYAFDSVSRVWYIRHSYLYYIETVQLTTSMFRHCPRARGLGYSLSIWAWVLVGVGGMLLLLLILGGVLAFIRNSKGGVPAAKLSAMPVRYSQCSSKTTRTI
jgi:hypothetical protein